MILRPYQSACVSSSAKGFVEFRKQLVVLPTGGGKTICFAHMAERFWRKRNERTLILAHREELVAQAADKIAKATGIVAEVEKAERRASLDATVVVGSVQTMQGDRLARWPSDHFGLVVCDEAHHVLAYQWRKTLSHFDSFARVLGVTATPDRGDKKKLGEYFENVAYECGILDLIADGYLSKIRIKSIPLKIDLGKVRQIAGDLDAGQLGDALAPYLDLIAEVIATQIPERKTLVFLPLVATSQEFVRLLISKGVRAEHVDGNSQDRANILSRFASGETRVLANAMLLTEGYDEPTIDCVCVLRPTRSRPLYAQMVGRGTRVSEGKTDLLLLDFLWLHEKHDIARPASLVAKSKKEEDSIQHEILREEEKDLQEAIEEAKAEREAALARELSQNRIRSAKFLSLEDVASLTGDVELSEWEPTMGWESKEPTEKQKQLLSKFKVACPSTKGIASMLISRLFQRRDSGLATVAQLKHLVRLGHPNPHTCRFEEAKAFLDLKFSHFQNR